MAQYIIDNVTEAELEAAEALVMLWKSWGKESSQPDPDLAQQLILHASETLEWLCGNRSTEPQISNSQPEVVTVPQSSPVPSETSPSNVIQLGVQEEVNQKCMASEPSDTCDSEVVTDQLKGVIDEKEEEVSETENVLPAATANILKETSLNTSEDAAAAGPSGIKAPEACGDDTKSDPGRITRTRTRTRTRKYKENKKANYGVQSPGKVKIEKSSELVPIGEGNAQVPARLLKTINWDTYRGATRSLLQAVFGRKVLATHNLTGKPSPAFPGRAPKGKLNSTLVNDVIVTIVERCGVTASMVRASITSKCADESKLLNQRQKSSSATSDDT